MLNFSNLILIIVTVLTGLMAGLFFGFSTAVIPGLHQLPDAGYLQSFQRINESIQNPVFLFCFMAPLILLPLSTWLQFKQGGSSSWIWMLAACLLYIILVFGITAAGNVPLNETLAKTDLTTATVQNLADHRAAFEPLWNKLHSIRMVANILSLVCCIFSCILSLKK